MCAGSAAEGAEDLSGGGAGDEAEALRAALKEARLELRLLQADNDGLQEAAFTYKSQLQCASAAASAGRAFWAGRAFRLGARSKSAPGAPVAAGRRDAGYGPRCDAVSCQASSVSKRQSGSSRSLKV